MIKGLFKSLKNSMSSAGESKEIIVESVKTVTGKVIQKKYAKQKVLGSGAFAECFITQNLQTKKLFATKVISKDNRNRIKLLNQLLVHQQLHHPNIVDFSHAFEDKHDIYVFLQLCPNNTLEHAIIKKGLLSKWQIKKFLYEIIQAMIYIHSKNVIHRDIKPRNIFLGNNNQIKIGDFGLATKLEFQGQKKRTMCGTPQYMPPQMIQGCGYGKEVDIWAVGVLLYEMYTAVTPFYDSTNQKITANICNINYEYSQKGIPKQALNLIRRMLIRNPQLRPSWQEILESSFFNDQIGKQVSSAKTPRGKSFHINFQSASNTYTPRASLKSQDQLTWGSKTLTSKNKQQKCFFDKKFSQSSTNGFCKNNFHEQNETTDYVMQTYQIGNDLIAYKTSNNSVGLLKKDVQVLHEGLCLKYIQLAKNGKNIVIEDQSKIDSKMKVILQNSKRKFQAIKPVNDEYSKQQFVYLTKFSKHKNIQMLRLSNNTIQIRFADKTDVLIEIVKQNQKNIKVINQEEVFGVTENAIMSENKQECKAAHLDHQQVSYIKKFLVSLGMAQPSKEIIDNQSRGIQNPETIAINKIGLEKESYGLRENVRTI